MSGVPRSDSAGRRSLPRLHVGHRPGRVAARPNPPVRGSRCGRGGGTVTLSPYAFRQEEASQEDRILPIVSDGPEDDGPKDDGPEDDGPEDDRRENRGSEDDRRENRGSEDDRRENRGSEDDGSKDDGVARGRHCEAAADPPHAGQTRTARNRGIRI